MKLPRQTKTEIKRSIELCNITDTGDDRIQYIADEYPNHYSNEQEYVDFQLAIADIVESQRKKTIKNQLENMGFFFHLGGDFFDTHGCTHTRGIWRTCDNGRREHMGNSWAAAYGKSKMYGLV